MRQKKLLLLILPIFYLIITGVFLVKWLPFYTTNPDPVYIYLFNGMTIASGHLKITYIDNPGIPVQYFCAAVIYINHLFSHSTVLYQDVLMNPEGYLHAICTIITLLFVLILWTTGYYILKRTGNIILAILFQLTLLIGKNCLYAQNPTPDSFIILSGMPFIAYLYYYSVFSYSQSAHKITLRHILIYASFSAFLVSCKYTCLPLLILVLFLLPTLHSRIQYMGTFVLFFLLFISPALSVWKDMESWIYDLLTHTGHYGQGNKGFVNSSEFFTNLEKLFKEDIYFTFIYILTSISCIIAFIKRKQTQPENKIYLRLLSGVWLSSSVLILFVAKHYSFWYMLPARLCLPLSIIGSYKVFRDILKVQLFQKKPLSAYLFYTFLTFLIVTHIKPFIIYFSQQVPHSTSDFLNKNPGTPIIMSTDYQCARVEPSLDFGNAYTSNFRNKYWEFLKKLYKYSYLYQPAENKLSFWDDIFYMPELFSKYPAILVYFYHNDSIQRNSILAHFCNWNDSIKLGDHKLIYSSPETNEYIYKLSGLQDVSGKLLADYTQTDFDFEKLTTDKSKFISTNGHDIINGANALSTAEHHSGNNSILVNTQNPYALNYPIKVLSGYMVNASIWRKSDDGWGSIVFSAKKGGDFYSSGTAVIDSDSNGWKQIEYKCLVPPPIKDSTIMFYLYYYGHGYAYFDDLSIKVYPMKTKQ